MMKMDGRDSAECQNWEKKDVNIIFEIVKLEKDITQIVFVSFIPKSKTKREVRGEKVQKPKMERESEASL